jgi:hypothetical protein
MSKPLSISHGRQVGGGSKPRDTTVWVNLSGRSLVPVFVRSRAPEWLIVIGASAFILVLMVSAVWDPSIRWLHFFQAWMYLAAIWLSLRKNRWGYFIGLSAAGLWAYANLFVNTFFVNGLQQLAMWIQSGHLARPDLLIAIPAWFSNLIVLVGCVWGYWLMPCKTISDVGRFVMTFALTTGFFALDMYLFQPRYLGMFPHLLHPHLP